tara:strand:- start:29568 stop:29822 length:255 start_codon:yes stop_codon:yes gene_type:complete
MRTRLAKIRAHPGWNYDTSVTFQLGYQKIKLTATAVKLVPKLANIADENDEIFFSILGKAERKTLISTLKKLADLHMLTTNPIE